ncbi:hypothetical protein B0H14DRAFT_2630025 [Mycena olivaceomarginata]|nr:hypothetical protein B0H14DRAFT_2630025 [Mycena olivaceomarginata]
MEKPISSPEHLCNGSLWFDILLDVFASWTRFYEDTLSEDIDEVGGDLRNETAKIKVDLEEANTELNAMKEFHQGHDMQHEQKKVNGKIRFMLEQDQEKLQHRNKELDDAYRFTGLMLTKAEDLAQQWADSLGNAETQLNERQAVKPHQDHGQVLQDEEDIMVINPSDDQSLQQLQTADEDLHAKFVNLEQEHHQTLKANKILEVEVAKKTGNSYESG